MTDFVRTDDAHFDALDDWPYEPRYHLWKDLRVHYVDEGPEDGPVTLLLHGMPTWAYLYRRGGRKLNSRSERGISNGRGALRPVSRSWA